MRIIPVVDSVRPYCSSITSLCDGVGVRGEVDTSGNRLAKCVRTAEMDKIPIIAVVGEKEMLNNTVTLR
ncbi:His/Gly/Thr/Pro-type tRNA ligase C-terminal domain-containing protein [Pantoea sp.]|uniref:His/Gly/Thr/Pro-type tRNA ligase C-terminal domain-containing protein n=1 Tax=Pantoea sp. TaxID=69393 RepID=UPI00338EFD7C